MFAPERIQEDETQHRLQGDPVGPPYRIVASTIWAIRHHHGGSVPPSMHCAGAPDIAKAYAYDANMEGPNPDLPRV
jgi:hypothetical protein